MRAIKGKRLSRQEAQALARAAIGPLGCAFTCPTPRGAPGDYRSEWCVAEMKDAITLEIVGRSTRSYREAFEAAGIFLEVEDD